MIRRYRVFLLLSHLRFNQWTQMITRHLLVVLDDFVKMNVEKKGRQQQQGRVFLCSIKGDVDDNMRMNR